MKNLEGIATKAVVVMIGVIAAGYVMYNFSTVGIINDAKKGFGA